jgi:hypothetical protein
MTGFFMGAFYVHADVEWEVKKQLQLKAQPLDIVASSDGKHVYILFEGRLLIYSLVEDQAKHAIPVDQAFDTLTLSDRNKLLILMSRSKRIVRFIEQDFIEQMSYDGLPYKGPPDAPVTLSMFIDYQ